MKRQYLIAWAVVLGMFFAFEVSAAEKLELISVFDGLHGSNEQYKAYIYGFKHEAELPIKKHEGCLVPEGCVPDDYLKNNVKVYYCDSDGRIAPYSAKRIDEGLPTLTFGEVMHIFQNATWNIENKWGGWKVEKIIVVFNK